MVLGRKWFRDDFVDGSPAVFLAIGLDADGDGFVRVAEAFRRIFFDVELSVDERIGLIHEASYHGWRLDEPLY